MDQTEKPKGSKFTAPQREYRTRNPAMKRMVENVRRFLGVRKLSAAQASAAAYFCIPSTR